MSKQLETYLNQLRSGLKELPENEREAEVEETRQHLLSLVEHRVEAGEEYEAALAAAIQQFGEPRATGNSLRRAWRRGQEGDGGRWATALHYVVAAGVAFQLITGLVPIAYLFWQYPASTMFQGNSFDTLWSFLWQISLCLFAVASLRAPQKLRLPFLAALATVGLFNVATVLPPGKFLTPLALNYYLFSQLSCFALSSWGVWLMVKQNRTLRRVLS